MAGTVVQEAGTLFWRKKQHIDHFTAFFSFFSGTFQSTDISENFFAEYPSDNRFLNVTEFTFDSNTVIAVSKIGKKSVKF